MRTGGWHALLDRRDRGPVHTRPLYSASGRLSALAESPQLAEYSGRVSDSGEGRWTSIAAIEEGVPTPVLTTALHERFYSRDLGDYGDKVLSAMRYQFGGHKERDN